MAAGANTANAFFMKKNAVCSVLCNYLNDDFFIMAFAAISVRSFFQGYRRIAHDAVATANYPPEMIIDGFRACLSILAPGNQDHRFDQQWIIETNNKTL